MKNGSVFVIALLLLSTPTIAQEESKFQFLVNGGLSFPQNPDIFRDVWKRGFNVGGGVGYRLARHLTVQAMVNYDRFPFDEGGLMDLFMEEVGIDPRDLGLSIGVEGGNVDILALSGELKASIIGDPDKLSPYVKGGAGVARLAAGDTTVSLSGVDPVLAQLVYGDDNLVLTETIAGGSDTNLIAMVGGGLDVTVGERVGIFVEVRYQFKFTGDERTDYASFRGGVKIGL